MVSVFKGHEKYAYSCLPGGINNFWLNGIMAEHDRYKQQMIPRTV
jgi:hypothetical protein